MNDHHMGMKQYDAILKFFAIKIVAFCYFIFFSTWNIFNIDICKLYSWL